MKRKNILAIALLLTLVASTAIVFHGRSVEADISNPHSVPPNNSITGAMLQSGVITDTNVAAGAAIQPSKVSGGTGTGDLLYDNGTTLGATSGFKLSTTTSQITAGGYNATNSQFCANGLCYIFPAADGTSGQFIKTDGSHNLSFATAASTTVTTFTASGTWNKPAACVNQVSVNLIGGGGGGGSGVDFGSNSAGGAGGTVGAVVQEVFSIFQVPASVSVTVGTGGAGGAGVSISTGNVGQPGTPTIFGGLAEAVGGLGGAAGTTGASNQGTMGAPTFGSDLYKQGGGGGSANTNNAGAGAASAIAPNTVLGGTAGSGSGGGGQGGSATTTWFTDGGSGGGGGTNNGSASGGGGNGGLYGGAGGGGGSGNNTSGAGGTGAAGFALISCN